jgi:hypothetical protein
MKSLTLVGVVEARRAGEIGEVSYYGVCRGAFRSSLSFLSFLSSLSAMSSIAGAVTSANVFGGDTSTAYFDIGVALEPATHAARVGCSVFVDNVVTSVGP